MDKELLYRYFDGNVSPEELHEIRVWQEASDENRDTMRRERKLFNALLLAGSPQQEGDKGLGIEAGRNQSEGHNGRAARILLRVAACVAVMLCLGAAYLWVSDDYSPNQLAYQTVRVPSGQRVELTLPDSTHVWVNANTTLRYPLAFGQERREVELDGEACFEVRHDSRCPFVVHTSQMYVKDLGTKFNIEAYSENNYQEVSLLEGKVMVGLAGETKSYVLATGKKLTVNSGKVQAENISDPDKYRWTEGLYCFSNKPVAEIMKDFEKYYGLRIVVNNRKLSQMVLSGKFRIAEGLDYALSVLQAEVPFKYKRNRDNTEILIE